MKLSVIAVALFQTLGGKLKQEVLWYATSFLLCLTIFLLHGVSSFLISNVYDKNLWRCSSVLMKQNINDQFYSGLVLGQSKLESDSQNFSLKKSKLSPLKKESLSIFS